MKTRRKHMEQKNTLTIKMRDNVLGNKVLYLSKCKLLKLINILFSSTYFFKFQLRNYGNGVNRKQTATCEQVPIDKNCRKPFSHSLLNSCKNFQDLKQFAPSFV